MVGLNEVQYAQGLLSGMLDSIYSDIQCDIDEIMAEYKHCFGLEPYTTTKILHDLYGRLKAKFDVELDELDILEAEILDAMECHEDSEHFEDYMNEPTKKTTPCDYPDNDGNYSCPYDAHGGDDCRNFCGLGVDE